jgi:hypothetical protein
VLLEAVAEQREIAERAATVRAGLVASMVYNVNRKPNSRALKPEDFLPRRKPAGGEETFESWRQRMNLWALRHNASVRA